MNRETNRIIGDILEINSDIIRQRVESKSPKIITSLKERHYRNRLEKLIKRFNKDKIVLDKSNIQELLVYLYTYNEAKYKEITNIVMKSQFGVDAIVADLLIDPDISYIKDIKYVINISSREEEMSILMIIHRVEGTVLTNTLKLNSLSYFDIDGELQIAVSKLNDTLLNILESFLLEYLERFKHNKGYMKEVKR